MKNNVKSLIIALACNALPAQAGGLLYSTKKALSKTAKILVYPVKKLNKHVYKNTWKKHHWDWSNKDLENVTIKDPNFLWGASTAAYQIEEDSNNTQWNEWVQVHNYWIDNFIADPNVEIPKEHVLEDSKLTFGLESLQKKLHDLKKKHTDLATLTTEADKLKMVEPGDCCKGWSQYKQDTALMKKMGMNSYRFSVAWDKIVPNEGQVNEKALEHYTHVIQELIDNGIQPFICLHHYTDPKWFAVKGAFTKKENIQHFVEFTQTVHNHLQNNLDFSNTTLRLKYFPFNSPVGYALPGYMTGDKPAGKKNKQLGMTVLKNMCEAHVQVYQAIKDIDTIDTQVGFMKNIYLLEKARPINPVDCLTRSMANKFQEGVIFNFFSKGTFSIRIPGILNVQHKNKKAPESVDFVGISYYSHAYIKGTKRAYPTKESRKLKEKKSGTERYPVYPEGIYRAVKKIDKNMARPIRKKTKKDIPLFIVENGMATHDDALRKEFYQKVLYAVSKAKKDGFDIRGYMTWSLMDNYEWGTLGAKNYGVLAVDFESEEKTRSIKDGSQVYLDIIKRSRNYTPDTDTIEKIVKEKTE